MRANSLTTSASTGMRSVQRQRVRGELARLYSAALRAARAGQASGATVSEVAAAIRALCQAGVSPQEQAEIERHAARLRPLIVASQQAQAESRPAREATGSLEAQLRQFLSDPRLPWGGWSVTRAMAQRLIARLGQQQPQRVLEAGSGLTTALLARYAQLTGARVVTLEHEPRFYRQTAALLERLGLRRAVDLRLAPLAALRCNGWGPLRWYRPLPDGPFDFVFVDGPPLRIGREGALFALAGQLSPQGELWLHNGRREHERACLATWQRAFRFDAALVDIDKGAWVLHGIRALDPSGEPGSAGRVAA